MRFLDEAEPGDASDAEPRGLITAVAYRPRISDEDRAVLYYTARDLDGFKRDVLREQREEARRKLREGRGADEGMMRCLVSIAFIFAIFLALGGAS